MSFSKSSVWKEQIVELGLPLMPALALFVSGFFLRKFVHSSAAGSPLALVFAGLALGTVLLVGIGLYRFVRRGQRHHLGLGSVILFSVVFFSVAPLPWPIDLPWLGSVRSIVKTVLLGAFALTGILATIEISLFLSKLRSGGLIWTGWLAFGVCVVAAYFLTELAVGEAMAGRHRWMPLVLGVTTMVEVALASYLFSLVCSRFQREPGLYA